VTPLEPSGPLLGPSWASQVFIEYEHMQPHRFLQIRVPPNKVAAFGRPSRRAGVLTASTVTVMALPIASPPGDWRAFRQVYVSTDVPAKLAGIRLARVRTRCRGDGPPLEPSSRRVAKPQQTGWFYISPYMVSRRSLPDKGTLGVDAILKQEPGLERGLLAVPVREV